LILEDTLKEDNNKSVKNGKPWESSASYSKFLEADKHREELKTEWASKNIEGMQVKVKRQASTGKFVVKTRLHPDFEPKKIKKKKKKKKVVKNDNS
jgi:hypothetical protein